MAKYCRKLYMNCALPPLINAADPLATDAAQGVGQLWVNSTNDSAWVNTDNTPGAAVWEALGGGGGSAYTPTTPTDWGVVPADAQAALDFLAAVDGLYYKNVFHVVPGLGNNAKAGQRNAPFSTLQAAITHVRGLNSTQVAIYLHGNTTETITVPVSAFPLAQQIAINSGRAQLRPQISGSFTCQHADTNPSNQIILSFSDISLPNNVVVQATAINATVDLTLNRCVQQNSTFSVSALRRLEVVDTRILDANLTITNCATTYSFNSTFRDLSGPGSIFVSDGAAPNHSQGTGNMVVEVFGKYRTIAATPGADFNSGEFVNSSPLFSIVNGGSPIFCRVSDEFVEPLSPLTIPSGVTFELSNCRSLADITVNSGGVFTSRLGCQLPAVSNAGTWTDYGSTVVSVSGDGTTTYNGTAIAATTAVTAATRTQLRTDAALDFDATSNNIAYNLLPLASTPLGHKISLLRKPGGGANTVTITPNGAETIDGLASIALVEYQHTALVNKGTFWSAQ